MHWITLASNLKSKRGPKGDLRGCNKQERERRKLSKTTKICKNSLKLLTRCLYLYKGCRPWCKSCKFPNPVMLPISNFPQQQRRVFWKCITFVSELNISPLNFMNSSCTCIYRQPYYISDKMEKSLICIINPCNILKKT